MAARMHKPRIRLAYRTPDAPSVSASTAVEDIGPFTLNTPLSLTQCIPVNISWTGGTPPFSLRASFKIGNSTLQFLPEFLGTEIFGTQFTWNTNVPSGMSVFFEVIDALSVHTVATNPIFVGEPSGPLCSLDFPTISVSSSRVPGTTITPSTVLITGTRTVAIRTTSTTYTLPLPTYPSLEVASGQSAYLLNKISVAVTALGAVALLLVGTFLWWRARRKNKGTGQRDTEKQDVTRDGHGDARMERPEYAGSAGRRSTDWSGRLPTSAENPFENPENIVYSTERIFATLDIGDQTPTLPRSINSPPSRIPDVYTPVPSSPLRAKFIPRLERRSEALDVDLIHLTAIVPHTPILKHELHILARPSPIPTPGLHPSAYGIGHNTTSKVKDAEEGSSEKGSGAASSQSPQQPEYKVYTLRAWIDSRWE